MIAKASEVDVKSSKRPLKIVHALPVHTVISHSPLSKESPDQNYRGFLHLGMLLLFVNMLRLVVENVRKYGLLLSFPNSQLPIKDFIFAILASSVLWINILISFLIEFTIVHRPNFEKSLFCKVLTVTNVISLIVIPTWLVWSFVFHPILGSSALCLALILCLKLISYHVVNSELRLLWKKKDLQANPYPFVPYPSNITLSNMFFFWIAPTLCYQPSYPKTDHFSSKFFLKRILELAGSLAMMHILIHQFAIPTVQNSMKPIDELDMMGIFERLLKLSISSLYIWLLGFYALFHSFLNAFAELLGFGDRMFYGPWWNAKTLDEYWRLWNTPVHQWLKRHVYQPLRSRGWSSSTCQILIFFISALAHEYLVAIPTHIFQGWAFLAMVLQLPLINFTCWYSSRKPKSSLGNFIFWITFCILGQPMCILLYYRAWVTRSSSSSVVFFF